MLHSNRIKASDFFLFSVITGLDPVIHVGARVKHGHDGKGAHGHDGKGAHGHDGKGAHGHDGKSDDVRHALYLVCRPSRLRFFKDLPTTLAVRRWLGLPAALEFTPGSYGK